MCTVLLERANAPPRALVNFEIWDCARQELRAAIADKMMDVVKTLQDVAVATIKLQASSV